jgi:D-alanyl-D-alanine carboxypeptidase (penicillin-binding protein 5/6)
LGATAAVAIPRLCVSATSSNQPRVPIASLTKMMTVWVVLHELPLTFPERGPCLVVNEHDVALYDYDVASGQSNARIVLGERICEGTLLRGLLVHSAGDYSQLLQSMIGWSPATFVRVMNIDARKMGLTRTHYVDLTGISPGDQSTAGNQATLAVTLMTDEPVVDQIVALTHVALPYNGVVVSYTPYIGVANVVGVKSGFTNPAGGCDVMAIKVTIGANTFLTYAVVLGEHGGNALGVAGYAALTLSRSLRPSIKQVRTPTGVQLEWVGPVADVKP